MKNQVYPTTGPSYNYYTEFDYCNIIMYRAFPF